MLNIKNKSNLFLAAFVFAALASFSDFAKADVEIDCSGKEGYQLTICEQQKALAEKNAKSNEKAEDKADKKAAKAAEQATEATNAQKAADEKRKAEYSKYNEASKTAEAAKKDAEKKMNDAIARGDTEAAKAARDEMTKQHKAAAMAYSELNSANEAKDEAYKAASKAQKEADKEKKKADKAAQKAEKEKIKAAEKAEKNANKDLKKAKKEYDKLQEKCTKDPDKCDVDALQAAQTNLMAAKRNADAATKNREDVDGTTAANEKAAAEAEAAAAEAAAAEEAARQQEIYDYMDEEAPNEAEIQAYNCKDSSTGESCTLTADNASTCKCEYKEVYTDANGNTKEGKVGTFDELDANGNPVAMQRCYEAKDDIFKYIACKAMTTLADVRVIVYTLAGFGLIAFAFAAIFNKISWKHLANLCIALFILSMMTPFISYFTQDNGAQITYGNYLPAGFTNISGSDVDAAANCDTSKGDVCPDVTVDTSAKDSKWSWKDLKNTVKSGINAAKTAYDTYKTVKNTVETTVDQAKKIGTAIKNSEGGLTGVLDTLGEVATASNTIFNTVQTGAGAVVANTSSIANDVQNAGKSGAELAFDKENQNRINELEKKLAAGNLSPEQQEWAKAELEQRKAAVDSNKVTDFANNQGQKALDKINSVAKTGSTVTNIATKASNAAQQGATIGGGIGTATGDTLGAIFGIATAAGEGIGAVEDNKQAKIDAANAEAKKQADAEAAAKRQEEIRQNNASYSQGKQWDNSYNAGMSQKQPTVQKPAASSGNNKNNTASGSKESVEKTTTGMPNYRDDNAPNGTVTTPTHSYYSPEQEAFDNAAGRNGGNRDTQDYSNTRPSPLQPEPEEKVNIASPWASMGGARYQESNERFSIGGIKQGTETYTDASGNSIENAYKNDVGQIVQTNPDGSFAIYDSSGKLLSKGNNNL